MRWKLWIEWGLLFLALPILSFLDLVPAGKIVLFVLPVVYGLGVFLWNRPSSPDPNPDFSFVIPLFRLCAAALGLVLVTRIFLPGQFFEFPIQRPQLWATVIILYPFLSALPQEFLYRKFYFTRYETLFPTPAWMIGSSAMAYSFLHLMYDNWVALVLTLLGGILFSITYWSSRRLLYPWVEHALYGQIIFTVGLGRFFYEPLH